MSSKLEHCVAMDAMCTDVMRMLCESQSVDHSHALGLIDPLVEFTDALQRYHQKLTVVYQSELRGLN